MKTFFFKEDLNKKNYIMAILGGWYIILYNHQFWGPQHVCTYVCICVNIQANLNSKPYLDPPM